MGGQQAETAQRRTSRPRGWGAPTARRRLWCCSTPRRLLLARMRRLLRWTTRGPCSRSRAQHRAAQRCSCSRTRWLVTSPHPRPPGESASARWVSFVPAHGTRGKCSVDHGRSQAMPISRGCVRSPGLCRAGDVGFPLTRACAALVLRRSSGSRTSAGSQGVHRKASIASKVRAAGITRGFSLASACAREGGLGAVFPRAGVPLRKRLALARRRVDRVDQRSDAVAQLRSVG